MKGNLKADTFFTRLNEMRQNDFLTDVTIKVDGASFKAHKNVLIAAGAFFEYMFNSEMKEAEDDVVHFPTITKAIFQIVIDFIYKYECSTVRYREYIDENNCQEVLEASDMLQLHNLKHVALRFLDSTSNADNVLGRLVLGKRYEANVLITRAKNIIQNNFQVVSSQNEVRLLEFSEIITLLETDCTYVEEEKSHCNIIMRWLNQDMSRCKHFKELLAKICFHQLPIVEREKFFNFCLKVSELNVEYKEHIMFIMENTDHYTCDVDRCTQKSKDTLVLFSSRGSIMLFDLETKIWYDSKLSAPHSLHTIPSHNNGMVRSSNPSEIIVCGQNQVAKLDTKRGYWQMLKKRSSYNFGIDGSGLAFSDTTIFRLCGFSVDIHLGQMVLSGHSLFDHIMEYSFETDRLVYSRQKQARTPLQLMDPICVADETNLWIIGGICISIEGEMQGCVPTKSVTFFSYKTSRNFTQSKELPYGLAGGTAIIHDRNIYVIGGYLRLNRRKVRHVFSKSDWDVEFTSDKVLRYNISADRWQVHSKLPTACCHTSVAMLNNKMYVCCGKQKFNFHGKFMAQNEIYVLDLESKARRWTILYRFGSQSVCFFMAAVSMPLMCFTRNPVNDQSTRHVEVIAEMDRASKKPHLLDITSYTRISAFSELKVHSSGDESPMKFSSSESEDY